MSAPETNVKKQEERHRGPLVGMRMVVIFALVLAAVVAVFIFARGNEPGEEQTEIENTAPAAAVEETEPGAAEPAE